MIYIAVYANNQINLVYLPVNLVRVCGYQCSCELFINPPVANSGPQYPRIRTGRRPSELPLLAAGTTFKSTKFSTSKYLLVRVLIGTFFELYPRPGVRSKYAAYCESRYSGTAVLEAESQASQTRRVCYAKKIRVQSVNTAVLF